MSVTAELETVGRTQSDKWTGYDHERYSAIVNKVFRNPAALTNAELALVEQYDPPLAARGRATRDGTPIPQPVNVLRQDDDDDSDLPDDRSPSFRSVFMISRRVSRALMNWVRASLTKRDARLAILEELDAARERRIGQLEIALLRAEERVHVLEAIPHMRYRGIWQSGVTYDAGAVVTSSGSCWVALETTQAKPGDSSAPARSWQLAVKSGRDGKDLR